MKTYKCQIDNLEFNTQGELIQHFFETHVVINGKGEDTYNIITDQIKNLQNVSLERTFEKPRFGEEVACKMKLYDSNKQEILVPSSIYLSSPILSKHYYNHFKDDSAFIEDLRFILSAICDLEDSFIEFPMIENFKIKQLNFGDYDSPTNLLVEFGYEGNKFEWNHFIRKNGDSYSFTEFAKAITTGEVEGELNLGTYPQFKLTINGIPLSELIQHHKNIKITLL